MTENEIYNWYAVRIAYRNEKKVKDMLEIAGIEYYMPFQTVERTWGEKKTKLEVPVIQGCGFIHISDFEMGMLSFMKEVSFFINRNEQKLVLSDEQIENIKSDPSVLTNYLCQ